MKIKIILSPRKESNKVNPVREFLMNGDTKESTVELPLNSPIILVEPDDVCEIEIDTETNTCKVIPA